MQISDIIREIESCQQNWETIGNLKTNDKLQIKNANSIFSEVKISESGLLQGLGRATSKVFSDNKADAQSTYQWIDNYRNQTYGLVHELLENIKKDPKVNPEILNKGISCLSNLQKSLHSAGIGLENLAKTYEGKNISIGNMTEILAKEKMLIKVIEMEIPKAIESLETKKNISGLDELEKKQSSQAIEILDNVENQISAIDPDSLRKQVANSTFVQYNNPPMAKHFKEELVGLPRTSTLEIIKYNPAEVSNIQTYSQVAVDLPRLKQIKLNGEIISSLYLPLDKENNSAPAAFEKIRTVLGDQSKDHSLTGVVASLLNQKKVLDIAATHFKEFLDTGEMRVAADDVQYDLYIDTDKNEIKLEIKGQVYVANPEDLWILKRKKEEEIAELGDQMHAFFKREISLPISQLKEALKDNDPSRLTDLKVTDNIGEIMHFPIALSRNMRPFVDAL